MNTIFLDFDGVLNSDLFYSTNKEKDFPHTHLDKEKVSLLNYLCQKCSADVVLTTTWRETWELSGMVDVLVKLGFVGKVIGQTPVAHDIRGN